jgi:hypothetical protein
MKFRDLKEFDILTVETKLACGIHPGTEATVVHIDPTTRTATCIIQFQLTAEEVDSEKVSHKGYYVSPVGVDAPPSYEEMEMAKEDRKVGESLMEIPPDGK